MNNLSDFANFGELHFFWGSGEVPNKSAPRTSKTLATPLFCAAHSSQIRGNLALDAQTIPLCHNSPHQPDSLSALHNPHIHLEIICPVFTRISRERIKIEQLFYVHCWHWTIDLCWDWIIDQCWHWTNDLWRDLTIDQCQNLTTDQCWDETINLCSIDQCCNLIIDQCWDWAIDKMMWFDHWSMSELNHWSMLRLNAIDLC